MKGTLVAGVAVALLVLLPAYVGTVPGPLQGSPSDDGVAPAAEGTGAGDVVLLGGDEEGDAVPVISDPIVRLDPATPPRCAPSDVDPADLVLLPTATGTVRSLPEMEILERAPVGDTVQSTYFRTTAQNREFRRGFFEFEVPAERGSIASAVLVLTETRGWTAFPMPPDVHELSYYAADGAVTPEDYDRPAVRCATFETDNNEPTAVFAFDVTALLRRFDGARLGFRVKLAADPEIGSMGFAGSQFGEPSTVPPQILLVLAP
jgi:hypothetical protein